jgi:site-specific recombinase XerD
MWKVDVAVDRFIDYCRINRGLSANTLKAYRADGADFLAFIGAQTPASDIGHERLRDYARHLIDDRGLKEASVKRRIATLKVIFRWLERENMIGANPFHRLDLNIRLPRRLPRSITAEELRIVIKSVSTIGPKYLVLLLRLTILLLFTTGLRVGELTAVRLGDLDQDEGTIHVRGKGNRERRVYLVGREIRELLTRYLIAKRKITNSEILLVNADGRPVTSQYVRRRLSRTAERAGLSRRLTPHMLRHAAATHLIEAGVDIRFVQKLLGHASIATTQIYTHISDTSLKETLIRANTIKRVLGTGGVAN